jgi:hypothetical protein
MSEVIKMSQEDIDRLKELQEEYNKKTFEFGRLYQAKIEIDNQLIEWEEQNLKLTSEYKKLQSDEIDLAKELEKNYGQGQVNLETGEFKKE